MRNFNIPYNFDPKLLAGLNILEINEELISCIYLPPYDSDYPSIHKNDALPDEKKYFEHIDMIQRQFPGKIQLLLQQPNDNYLMTGQLLKKYLDLGITKFCVGSLNQAKEIKELLSEAKISGSITMHITKEKIEQNKNNYLNYFDDFVLDLPYYRDIDKIYNLPKEFKYVLILNLACNSNCSGDFHWFADNKQTFICPYKDKRTWSETCIIRPFDLSLFDSYVSSYEIEGRGFPTYAILTNLLLYIENDFEGFFPNTPPNELLYKKNKS